MRLSLPATVSRLMSAIASSFLVGAVLRARALVLHALGGMKTRVAPIFLVAGPVRCHPRRPAKLAELPEADRFGGARRDLQFGVVFELLAVVEEHQVGQRLAKIAGRQEPD